MENTAPLVSAVRHELGSPPVFWAVSIIILSTLNVLGAPAATLRPEVYTVDSATFAIVVNLFFALAVYKRCMRNRTSKPVWVIASILWFCMAAVAVKAVTLIGTTVPASTPAVAAITLIGSIVAFALSITLVTLTRRVRIVD